MKDNKYIIPVLIVISVILVIIGSTFAYWNWQSTSAQKTNITFTTGANFSCSADGGGSITNTNYFVPTDCTNTTYAIKREITTNITNSGSNPVYLDMWLNVDSIGSGLSNSDNFMYALTTDENSCSNNVVASGNFKGLAKDDKVELLSGVTTASTYYLWIWLDAAETSQSTMNQSVNLTLGGSCTNQEPQMTLYDKIASQADLTKTIYFSQASSDTNGKGVYRFPGTESNTYPVYYYRGDIDNNHVKFANFCWKIVRTTDTGGVKLIYDGVPSGEGTCNNTETDTHISTTKTAFNTNYNSPAYVGYMYGDVYTNSGAIGTNWYYGPDVTYENGTYTLTAKGSYNVEKKSTISGTNLTYQHYTCGSTTATTCTSVRYVYNVSGSTARYITLTNGKKVEDALTEMFSNTTDSTIKTAIDTWYQNNMTSYTNKLEDTVYCNDRSIGTLNGWNPDGGSTTASLLFSGYNRAYSTYQPSLSCTNKNDAFTVIESATGNGKLTYPVGLLTSDEAMLAGMKGNSGVANYLNNNTHYWLGSPYSFYDSRSYEFSLFSGNLGDDDVDYANGTRVVVSLKPGMKISGGDGSSLTPYEIN